MAKRIDLLLDRHLNGTLSTPERAELLSALEAAEGQEMIQSFIERTANSGQFQDMSPEEERIESMHRFNFGSVAR